MSKINSEAFINVLWTGGWDSTFRMIQLARDGRKVQPFYVIDPFRKSTLIEMRRMDEIRNDLLAKYPSSEIAEVSYIKLSSINVEQKYIDAHTRLSGEHEFGWQYRWIAALSRQISNLELCIEKNLGDNAATLAATCYSKLMQNPKDERSDEWLIFGALKLPVINYTKPEMAKEAKRSNDLDTLNKTWFCFDPINNSPCGLCNPCKQAVNNGMISRFSRRGKLYSKSPFFFSKMRKILRRFV